MADSANWFDTKTQAEFQKLPPEKLAPPDLGSFSLVLLERGKDLERVNYVVKSLVRDTTNPYGDCPLVLRRNLSLTEAMVGQFELICADSISVFLRDEVVRLGDCAYLRELYKDLRHGDEFDLVTVHIHSVPDTDDGKAFLRQFFGQTLGIAATHSVHRKKARVMAHWGAKLGATMDFPNLNAGNDQR